MPVSLRTSFKCAAAILAFLCLGIVAVFAAPLNVDSGEPVNFEAKQLVHDEDAQTVTATGDVELTQGGKILRADKMVYHLDTDTVQAIGNVSLLDQDGSVHFAEYVELNKSLKDGFIQGLLSMLADGSRFTASEARREGGVKTTMTEATYTPCRVCETDPHPLWQLRADKLVHDEEKKEIKYKNARLEFMGVPLAWTPIFSHADPSVKRKSGFLRPDYGWSDNTGTYVQGGYYYSIAPDKDATVMIRPTTQAGVLTQGEWRQRFENGRIKLKGSFAKSDRTEEDGRVENNRLRGHVFAEGLFDLDNKWRAGFDLKRASDKEYLKLYDLDDKANVLENEVYAERFSGRDYSRVSAVNIQDLRLGQRPSQPEVVPFAEHHMLGEPQSLLGGRWSADVSAVQLQRPGSGQDLQRGTARAGWQRRDISRATGLAVTYDAGLQGDGYTVQNNAAAGGDNTDDARGQAYAAVTGSYPLVKRLNRAEAVVEPIAGVSYSTHVNNDADEIPNEDSLDVQVDANSLFSENRFPGTDREEDGPRLNYGMKAGLHGDDGRYGKVFVGQSYRFDDNNGLFPEGSGLENHASDIVGQVSVGSDIVNADYRVQLDQNSLAARRHEVQATGTAGRLTLDTRFIYLDAIAGTGFIEPREQWQVGGDYRLNQHWTLSSGTLLDFGAEPGLRKGSVALSYADECFSFAAQGTRNLINEASGESGTVLMLRVGLKNIGEFESPQIQLKPAPQDVPQ